MPEPVLDPAVLESLRQLTSPGEPDVMAQVFELFLREVPKRIDLLRSAWANGDAAEVHRSAHSLKGSAGNVGAKSMLSVCREIDDRSRVGDLSGTKPLVDALDREYASVEAEMRRVLG